MTALASISRWLAPDYQCLWSAHRGPVCGFLVFWLQIATEVLALWEKISSEYVRIHPVKPCLINDFITQSNFDGSNLFGTMKICSRQRLFEPRKVTIGTTQGGIMD